MLADRDGSDAAEVKLVIVETTGDKFTTVPLHTLGGQGIFVKEVQAAVLRGEADAAVHSAKDLPAAPELSPEGLVLASFPERADPRDLLVGGHWDTLPTGAIVATGSVRRRTQLANLRPDLTYTDLRGNIGTRLAAVGRRDVVAVIVAKAAADRLGWEPPDGVDTEALDRRLMVPQVGQGALAVECRTDDGATQARLSAIDDAAVRRAVTAERAYLSALGGGCTLPVGAYAELVSDEPGSEVELIAILASEDGRVVLRHTARGTDPERLGSDVAHYLLVDCGGTALGSWGDGDGTTEAAP
jgi:hydroxymethylbilane synthase